MSSSSDDDSPAAVETTAATEETTAAATEEPAAATEETTAPKETAHKTSTRASHRSSGSGPVVRFDISTSVSSNAIAQSAIESLAAILPNVPPSLSSSSNPALDLLNDSEIAAQISSLLRHPSSGAGDNNLCRWLYDTFQSANLDLKLVVLRFVPVIVGVYLSRVSRRKSLAGFEAVLLALYAHETNRRASQPVTVNIPDLQHPSIYHESKSTVTNNATALNLAVISPSLEPHGMVRSTKRARIVAVALELYYTKIEKIPESSKIEFCEFCEMWAGQDGEIYRSDEIKGSESRNEEKKEESNGNGEEMGRIPLPWEILQPVLRVLGHCLLGTNLISKIKKNEKSTPLFNAAIAAIRRLYARSMHDINPKAILATGSLVKLGKMAMEPLDEIDYTEIPFQSVIHL